MGASSACCFKQDALKAYVYLSQRTWLPLLRPDCSFHVTVGEGRNAKVHISPSVLNRVTAGLRACFAHFSPLWVVFLNGASLPPSTTTPTPAGSISHRAVKEAGQDMQVFICSTACVFRGAQIRHTSAADRLAIVRLCSSGRTGEISSGDGGWQHYFPWDLLPNGMHSHSHTHIYWMCTVGCHSPQKHTHM